jgi:23S rRNA (cytosine1962-C5)-methyltransferase
LQQARIYLKKNKERPILQKHHWIYSGAVKTNSSFENGQIVEVYSSSDQKLGLAVVSKGRSILGHMLAFGDKSIEETLEENILSAINFRKKWVLSSQTTAVRLIHAESDGIPGLIVDLYGDVIVLQISNVGIELFRDLIVQLLVANLKPKSILEKSTSFLRKKEGLPEVKGVLYGEKISEVEIQENGLKYLVDLESGQKTGLFLDQREMRALVKTLKPNRVLNCFAYTGGFSISALSGGSNYVESVEISAKCGPRIDQQILLNSLDPQKHRFVAEDVFTYLKNNELAFDLVILDPPAFVKKREDINQAFRAYKELNSMALKKMEKGSLLLTCSCSYHVSEELFQNIVFRASLEAKREVKIIETQRLAFDHPTSIYHPETSYLKSLLLYVN